MKVIKSIEKLVKDTKKVRKPKNQGNSKDSDK